MIVEYLMRAWEEYRINRTYPTLIEFANKTFPHDGTDKLFIGCALILITTAANKYYATTNAMLSILCCGKEKIGKTNLLMIYYERKNTDKNVSKYLKDVLYSSNFDKYLDVLIDYYSGWIFDYRKIFYRECEDKIKDYM